MTTRDPQDDYQLLVEQYVSGELREDDAGKLCAAIEKTPEFAEKIYEQQYFDFLLKRYYQSESSLRFVLQVDRICHPEEYRAAAPPRSHSPETASKPSSRRPPRRWGTLLSVVCVSLVFASVLFLHRKTLDLPRSDSSLKILGEITAAVDTVWEREAEVFRTGQRYCGERIQLRSGTLEILLDNDVCLALEGPVDWSWETDMTSFCRRGRISAYVPPKAVGYEIHAPILKIRDLGTEFVVDVGPDHTQFHVVSGKIETRSPQGPRKEWNTGEAVQVDSSGSILNIPLSLLQFLTRQQVRERLIRSTEKQRAVWTRQYDKWNNDEHLLFRLDFEQEGNAFSNLARGERRVSGGGDLRQARRTTGRWPSKYAVACNRAKETVLVDIPGRHRSLSFVITLRIDRLDKYANALLMSREFGEGRIAWQVNRDGAIQFLVQDSTSHQPSTYRSDPVVTPRDYGAWHQLALVVDRDEQRISVYFNGELRNSFPLRHSCDLDVGRAEIGNLFRETASSVARNLNGAVDEIMIFGRPLQTEEIEELYRYSGLD